MDYRAYHKRKPDRFRSVQNRRVEEAIKIKIERKDRRTNTFNQHRKIFDNSCEKLENKTRQKFQRDVKVQDRKLALHKYKAEKEDKKYTIRKNQRPPFKVSFVHHGSSPLLRDITNSISNVALSVGKGNTRQTNLKMTNSSPASFFPSTHKKSFNFKAQFAGSVKKLTSPHTPEVLKRSLKKYTGTDLQNRKDNNWSQSVSGIKRTVLPKKPKIKTDKPELSSSKGRQVAHKTVLSDKLDVLKLKSEPVYRESLPSNQDGLMPSSDIKSHTSSISPTSTLNLTFTINDHSFEKYANVAMEVKCQNKTPQGRNSTRKQVLIKEPESDKSDYKNIGTPMPRRSSRLIGKSPTPHKCLLCNSSSHTKWDKSTLDEEHQDSHTPERYSKSHCNSTPTMRSTRNIPTCNSEWQPEGDEERISKKYYKPQSGCIYHPPTTSNITRKRDNLIKEEKIYQSEVSRKNEPTPSCFRSSKQRKATKVSFHLEAKDKVSMPMPLTPFSKLSVKNHVDKFSKLTESPIITETKVQRKKRKTQNFV